MSKEINWFAVGGKFPSGTVIFTKEAEALILKEAKKLLKGDENNEPGTESK